MFDSGMNLRDGLGSCRQIASVEVELMYSSKNMVPVRPVERIKFSFLSVGMIFGFSVIRNVVSVYLSSRWILAQCAGWAAAAQELAAVPRGLRAGELRSVGRTGRAG